MQRGTGTVARRGLPSWSSDATDARRSNDRGGGELRGAELRGTKHIDTRCQTPRDVLTARSPHTSDAFPVTATREFAEVSNTS